MVDSVYLKYTVKVAEFTENMWLNQVCKRVFSWRGLNVRACSSTVLPGYQKVGRLERTDENVKKMFDLKFASQRESNKAIMAATLRQFEGRPGDTGNTAASIAALTVRIKYLTEHMKANRKDKSCLRSLLRQVHRRRKLLLYAKRKDFELYHLTLKELGIRPPVLLKYAQKSRKKD